MEKDKDGNVIPGTGVKVPDALGNCTRNAELSLAVTGNVAQAQTVVKPTGHAADRRKISDGSAAEFYVRFNGGAIQTFTNKKDRDDAVVDFKKEHPNAKVEKWED